MSRSETMARVGSRNTSPELALRRALWAAGLRYRLHRALPGTPDLSFVGARLAVFVDGCFWHGCPRHYSAPATRAEFWANKLRRNVDRDRRVGAELSAMGWTFVRVWEHEIRRVDEAVERIRSALRPEVVREVRAPAARYRAPPLTGPWFGCPCGSLDVCVVAVSGPGGLSPRARRPIERATLRCRVCTGEREARVTSPRPES